MPEFDGVAVVTGGADGIGEEVARAFGAAGASVVVDLTGVYRCLKHELRAMADRGVRVNAVCPGFTDTPMLDEVGVTADESVKEHVQGLHPMDRFSDPCEIADAIVWLCSPEASYVTGTALPVDGGYLSR
jgi:NAD(P)-dependent dehydrogenase (short-subunit alcohol dehydrogenase family)